jgi:hypothetical protein
MKKKLKLFITSIMLICTLVIPSTLANAKTDVNDVNINISYSDEIIGRSDTAKSNTTQNSETTAVLPNYISLYWTATENSIDLQIRNLGVDTLDFVMGTIYAGDKTYNFSVPAVHVGMTQYSVFAPIQKCYENITVSYYGVDGPAFGHNDVTGSRQMPYELLNLWGNGSFVSIEQCLDYHYYRHGLEVGAINICAYVRLADYFRDNLISGIQGTLVPGVTPNLYRYRNNGMYVDVVRDFLGNPTGKLISFGK